MNRFLYLHGFASSSLSSKALWFRQRFREAGSDLEIPDLVEGPFEEMTLSKKLEVVDRVVGEDIISFVGSSMGGYVASIFASQHPNRVDKMVLLAPGFGFPGRWVKSLGAEKFDTWRSNGTMEVFHHGLNEPKQIGFGLYEDALHYPEEPDFLTPTLILHGDADDVVPFSSSEQFAKDRENVRLVEFESDHSLSNVLEPMWEEMRPFLLS